MTEEDTKSILYVYRNFDGKVFCKCHNTDEEDIDKAFRLFKLQEKDEMCFEVDDNFNLIEIETCVYSKK